MLVDGSAPGFPQIDNELYTGVREFLKAKIGGSSATKDLAIHLAEVSDVCGRRQRPSREKDGCYQQQRTSEEAGAKR